MSFQAMTWAVAQKLPSSQKMVLLMLANHCNGHTGQCNPCLDKLADECGMSKESVRNQLKILSEKGFVEVIRRFADEENRVCIANQYKLNMGGTPKSGGHLPQNLGDPPPKSGGHTNYEPVIEPRIKETKQYVGQTPPDSARRILEHLNNRTDRSYKPIPANLELIKARLKEGFTEEKICMVIDRKVDDWNEDDKMRDYLRPATLFNKTKFAQYEGQTREWKDKE